MPHIILTGGSGFLGGCLRNRIIRDGLAFSEIRRDIVVVDGHSQPHNGDSKLIAKAISHLENPVLVHLAAHFVSRHNSENLQKIVSGSVGFSALVYDAFFNAGGRAVVTASSAWQYDVSGSSKPANLYAALKSCALHLLSYYLENNKASGTELVFFDTYGPGDSRPKLIPQLLRSWNENEEFIASSGLQPINITHVNDVCCAILQSVSNKTKNKNSGLETFAVKSEDEMTVRQLIEMVRDEIAPGLKVSFQSEVPVYAPRKLNTSIPIIPGWKPLITLSDGLSSIFVR